MIVTVRLGAVCCSPSDCERLVQRLSHRRVGLDLIGVGDITKGRLAELLGAVSELDRRRLSERAAESQAARRSLPFLTLEHVHGYDLM